MRIYLTEAGKVSQFLGVLWAALLNTLEDNSL